MKLSETFLREFEQESRSTRRALERVPEDRLTWKPHPKSMTLGRLASHVAELPSLGLGVLGKERLDVAPGGERRPGANLATRAEILELFDKNVAALSAALAAYDDDLFAAPWSLERNGEPMFTLPRAAALRGFVFNHFIHHRGQLSVYLRLTDTPVPAIYGNSADEPGFARA